MDMYFLHRIHIPQEFTTEENIEPLMALLRSIGEYGVCKCKDCRNYDNGHCEYWGKESELYGFCSNCEPIIEQ